MKILIISDLNVDYDNLTNFNEDSFHSTPWIFNLSKGLAERNHSVTVCSFSGKINRNYYYSEHNYEIYLFKSPSKIKQLTTFFGACIEVINANININNYDIVNVHGCTRAAIIATKLNIPQIITIHASVKQFFRALKRNKLSDLQYVSSIFIEKYVLNKIKNVIVVSNKLNEEIREISSSNNINVVSNAIDKRYFFEVQREFDDCMLFIGSLTNRKNVKILLKILLDLKNIKLKLIYQHADAKYMNEINDYINENKLYDRVMFLGRKNVLEMISEIRKSTVLVLPSLYETFGMVLAEASAVGIPVIAFDIEATKTVIKDSENGFLIKNGDYNGLLEKIRLLFNDKEKAQKLGNSGKILMKKLFHPTVIAEQTETVIYSIIKLR